MNLREEIHKLLRDLGPGKMSSLAYDTAWVARLGEIDWELSSPALSWLSENQLPDGSWGAKQPFYYHDRVISTLAAMIALTHRGRRAQDKKQIDDGLLALEKITSGATEGLQADRNGATVGFELIVPTLVAEAEKLGIIKQQGDQILGRMKHLRKQKMSKMKGIKINRYVTMAFSAEMAGMDGQHILDIGNLQERNGSVGHSPSASAYFAHSVVPKDPTALNYLHNHVNTDGGVPDLVPFDVYERAWILWNLSLIPSLDQTIIEMFKPHLSYLEKAWKPNLGIGFSNQYSVPDGDDTIITFDLLRHYGYDVDIESILSFEEETHFRCYNLEVGISPSVNIHALKALRSYGYTDKHLTIQKILTYLRSIQTNDHIWVDKWHSSPYYSTAHFVIACAGFSNKLAQNAVQWILSTQQSNGCWGYYMPTPEETAYCIQALSIWQLKTGAKTTTAVKRGVKWLQDNDLSFIPPLWIGKGLYSADLVVRATIISALMLAQSIE